ncbi:MAG: ABC-type transport system, involved in lipoprotein release, ATPase component [candidate division TM6 bacterium GW2011_GWF2_37_49]|nr:MAG: ABC-type transport system, involved in lipoprotein release, ATPase component [candidate division TM6 bacterium GW2011_GWF2_37_49]
MIEDGVDKLIANMVCKDFFQGDKAMPVLNGVSVEFEKGKTYAITGVSGSGKSTLLHILGGLDVPTSGTVLLNDLDIYSLKASAKERILNQRFGFVFQFHYLIKELTVLENIIVVGLIKGQARKECIARAEELLVEMGLPDKRNNYPSQLSGGQQQRVAIARAVFNKPCFLLADEPTGNLDKQNAQTVVDLILRAQSDWGMGVILCSHDPDVYNKMGMVYNLHDGILTIK